MRRVDAEFTAWARLETPGLLRRAVLLCADRQLAEDLVQETLVKLYTHWSRVDADRNPIAYAHTILFNVFISHRRRRSSTERPTDEVPERPAAGAGASTSATDLRLDLAHALAALAPRDRCVVVARYLDDRSVAEVAQMLGRTEQWVRTTTFRALRRLRESPDLLVDLAR